MSYVRCNECDTEWDSKEIDMTAVGGFKKRILYGFRCKSCNAMVQSYLFEKVNLTIVKEMEIVNAA